MNTTESNKLIAEFMGDNSVYLIMPFTYELGEESSLTGEVITLENAEDEVRAELADNEIINENDACIYLKQYHNDWGLLMPVVEKIESLVFPNDVFYNFNILGGCQVNIISSDIKEFGDYSEPTKLLSVYKAVVEFIKWYNENKK